MIDIIGYIKPDESKYERVKMLIACIRSYAFLKNTGATFNLCMHEASEQLSARVDDELNALAFQKTTTGHTKYPEQYGDIYCSMIKNRSNPFVINFMEDQFMMLDDQKTLMHLLGFMKQYNADLCKASFFQVEQNSQSGIGYVATIEGLGMVYHNNAVNHTWYQRYYGSRYYIGVNFITTRQFALRIWQRKLGARPHEYEITGYDSAWEHRAVIPGCEIMAAIDDDHGEPGTCLLKRPDAKKFWDIYKKIN